MIEPEFAEITSADLVVHFWRLTAKSTNNRVDINPDAIDEMYDSENQTGTTIILRSGRVVEVFESLEQIHTATMLTEIARENDEPFDYSAD